jgi:hypothetical protein
LRGADPIHHRGEEINDPDIDRNPLAGMMVAQKERQLFHRERDRPEIVAIGASEAFAGMGVEQSEPAQRRRGRRRASRPGRCQQTGCQRQEQSSIHRPGIKE